MKLIPRTFYSRNTRVVAIELLGHVLVFEQDGVTFAGKIVETEAYFGSSDPASHACRGLTDRNRPMFGPAGKTYVYFTYGNHHCLNVVTERDEVPGAVLIRALEPLSGVEVMKKRRQMTEKIQLTNGPGKLTQAFGIDREHSELDLTKRPLYIKEGEIVSPLSIKATTRIGISSAKDLPLRFYLLDNPYVSKK
jgi:DNA-3-methyladenine glycosylase